MENFNFHFNLNSGYQTTFIDSIFDTNGKINFFFFFREMHICNKNNIILSSSIQCRLIDVSENWKSILYASLSKWIFADLIGMCDSSKNAADFFFFGMLNWVQLLVILLFCLFDWLQKWSLGGQTGSDLCNRKFGEKIICSLTSRTNRNHHQSF